MANAIILIILLLFASALIWNFVGLRRKNFRLNLKKQLISLRLREQRKISQAIFDYTQLGISLLGLDGKFIQVNKSVCDMLGETEANLLEKNFYTLLPMNDVTQLQNYIQMLFDNKSNVCQFEHEFILKNNERLSMLSTLSLVRDQHDQPLYFIIQMQDISFQKNAEERLKHMAYHDPLTNLANRNKLEQFITHILASAKRHKQGFALLFLDLDRFKNINDTIGHEAGDTLLQIIAERLHNTVRSTDMVARLGGDEFVLVITDVKKTESIALIAQKVLENVLRVVVIKGQEIYITTSIGISFYPYDGTTMQSLMKNADLALYRAKDHGRNNYQFYTVEMTTRAQEKMALQNALGHALAKNEFDLHYQPKMDLKTRQITGVEALLRWKNKEFGSTMPDEIISLAEETGLIIPVSDWVLKTACHQLKKWHAMGLSALTMAVNCTARQFKQATFVDDVARVLSEYGLSPHALEIEVTEATIMQDPENTLRVLYALKDLGVRVAIDDFGTGYWSLSNLRRLSVDAIKIDKTFIKQVMADETSAAIVNAIIAMVKTLNIRSIAEGVENRQQYDFLMQNGCVEIQGYYLTQALPAEAITEFLKHPIPAAEALTNITEDHH